MATSMAHSGAEPPAPSTISLVRAESAETLLRKYRRWKRELTATPNLQNVRISILGGVTTNELACLLELCLLAEGFLPEIRQSEYNRFFEDAVLDPREIAAFHPEIVFLDTHFPNIQNLPSPGSSAAEVAELLEREVARFKNIWRSLASAVGCQIIQNNFEHPPVALLGSLDCVRNGGHTRFVQELNLELARAAEANGALLIHDLNTLAARMGHRHYFDWNRWFGYKILTSPAASLEMARSLTAMVGAMLGRAKKCLVLDLDNTLWGGVIGDDGLNGIQIGKETAVAEAYTAFQMYCLRLRERGVLLAVCSKNNPEIARTGFDHPDSVLKLEHFASFHASWEPKDESIRRIAQDLNIGLDSLVFVDDNPAERALVAGQLPSVTVPEIGSEVALYPSILDAGHYFETVSLSAEDMARAETYALNRRRQESEGRFADYGAYLASLQMQAEIEPFRGVYMERIAQLINKTNQFNLTTRRYTLAQVQNMASDPAYICLYGKLRDVYGDHGLVSVVIGRMDDRATLHIDLWLMSCRVLKRDMELAMMDALLERAREKGAARISGSYCPTPKNGMVEHHYAQLGFVREGGSGDCTLWSLPVESRPPLNRHIDTGMLIHG